MFQGTNDEMEVKNVELKVHTSFLLKGLLLCPQLLSLSFHS